MPIHDMGLAAIVDRPHRSWRAWVIWGLQSTLAALVLILLWQPAITVAELKPQQNIIAVLVDDSRSMGIADNGTPRQTVESRLSKTASSTS